MATPSNPNPTFDFSDFSKFNPLYTADQGQSDAQLQMLQDAMAYAQAHPELPDSTFVMGELDKNLKAQGAVSGYNKAVSGSTQLNALKGSSANLQRARDEARANVNPNNIRTKEQYDNMVYWGQQAAEYDRQLQANLAEQKTLSSVDVNKSQADLLTNFRLPGQDWEGAKNKLTDFYKGPGGQIDYATQGAQRNLYQIAYNLRKGINEKAAQLGASSSGSRQRALGNVNTQAVKEATRLRGEAESDAQKNIDKFSQDAAEKQRQQQELEDRIRSGTAGDLFGQGTQDLISSYRRNSEGQAQKAMQGAQQDIAKQKADDDMWNDIFSLGGKGLGMALGAGV